MTLGSLIRGLSKIGLWPRPPTLNIDLSVAKLAAQLKVLDIPEYPKNDSYYSTSHRNCNIKAEFHAQIDLILRENSQSAMTDSITKHMKEQDKKWNPPELHAS